MIRPEKHWYPAHYQSHKQTNNKGGRLRNYWKNLRCFYNNLLLLLLALCFKILDFLFLEQTVQFLDVAISKVSAKDDELNKSKTSYLV